MQEFWGGKFPESLYLWHGAKNNCLLNEIVNNQVPTMPDYFSTQYEMQKCHDFCKSFYYLILPKISDILNRTHNLNQSTKFWQLVLGYWLFRHIFVCYEKFLYLESLDINDVDIGLLHEDYYYIPIDHADYLRCFAGDFGVNQLVSQYFRIFKKNTFSEVRIKYDNGKNFQTLSIWKNSLKKLRSLLRQNPKIGLLGVSMGSNYYFELKKRTCGMSEYIDLPYINNKSEPDFNKRKYIVDSKNNDNFESFFIESAYYCMPRDFIENFMNFYDCYSADINKKNIKFIVSEFWISDIPSAIYVALAKEKGIKFICYQHGASTNFYKNYMGFIDFDVADVFLSTGWSSNSKKTVSWASNLKKLVSGGFSHVNITPYDILTLKNKILFVTRTNWIYGVDPYEYGATNLILVKNIEFINSFINYLPPKLKDQFMLRPRSFDGTWNLERILDCSNRNIKIDKGDFSDSVLNSKVVIIDHMATGFAEILLMKAPFILLINLDFFPMTDEVREIFDDLIECKVLHTSSESAISHLSFVYYDMDTWWQSDLVQCSVEKLSASFLAPGNLTTDYLASLLDGNRTLSSYIKHPLSLQVDYFLMRVKSFFKYMRIYYKKIKFNQCG